MIGGTDKKWTSIAVAVLARCAFFPEQLSPSEAAEDPPFVLDTPNRA